MRLKSGLHRDAVGFLAQRLSAGARAKWVPRGVVAAIVATVILALWAPVAEPRSSGLPAHPVIAQQQGQLCFPETGYCIQSPQFRQYFDARGGVRILGYPVSREFTLEGFRVQIFQRVVLQQQGDRVERLNVLDSSVLPLTRANGSVFPPPAPDLALGASPGSPDYAQQVINFVRTESPNVWQGLPVGFFNLFNTTVPVDASTANNPGLVTLFNLEIWGLPTSQPAFDPNNGAFAYQRFQRGIMHFRSDCACTDGVLVGDYLKAVLTGRNLPPDLEADVQGNRFYRQYNPASPNWVSSPAVLPNTDLTAAFEPGTGASGGQSQPPSPTPTPIPFGDISGRVVRYPSQDATAATPVGPGQAQVEVFRFPALNATTGANGRYEIKNVPYGEHYVYARFEDGTTMTTDLIPVDVKSPSQTLDISTRRWTPATTEKILKGSVADAAGNPVGGATVWRVGSASRTASDPNGSFQLVYDFEGGFIFIDDASPPSSGTTHPKQVALVAVKDGRWGFLQVDNASLSSGGRPTIRLDRGTSPPTPPVQVYDLIASAPQAAWSDNTEQIAFSSQAPGTPTAVATLTWNAPVVATESRGYAQWLENQELEDGSRPARVLEAQPRRVANGEIRGLYPQVIEPRAGDLFIARVGFTRRPTGGTPAPAPGAQPVTFAAIFVPEGGGAVITLSDRTGGDVFHEHPYSGSLQPIVLPMEGVVGQKGRIMLIVNAGSTPSAEYHPVWVEAQIVRER
ncbi:MAG TPA: carboxypeptidase-like regulatory domain-containing protein [Chloroflexota bacterium]|nr:carboxypeptidase-like regulatory domain-containing protein [Chloroflexota bacterium]